MARVFHRDPALVAVAQDGYGDPRDEDVLDAFVQARRFPCTVWSIVMARVQPEYGERSEALLAGYRQPG